MNFPLILENVARLKLYIHLIGFNFVYRCSTVALIINK